jgi:serine/threonine-protein kinase
MGVVLAATHEQLEQVVAIKVMQDSLVTSREAVGRFLREARMVAKLKSEHVARVSDVGILDTGAPYIVMELLEGKDLGALLHIRGPLPVRETVGYLLQTCEALAEAHAIGIIHRDLKPENLFLTTDVDRTPLLKVLDFGLAKALTRTPSNDPPVPESLTRSVSVMGTPAYMSPEQLRATRDVDLRADVWALGVVAYELLAARLPFDSTALPDLCAMIVRDPPRPLAREDVPPGLEAAIMKCLEKEPTKRYSRIASFAAAIEQFADPESTSMVDRILRVQGASEPPPRSSQRAVAVLPSSDLRSIAPAAASRAAETVDFEKAELRVRTPTNPTVAEMPPIPAAEAAPAPMRGRNFLIAGTALCLVGVVALGIAIAIRPSSAPATNGLVPSAPAPQASEATAAPPPPPSSAPIAPAAETQTAPALMPLSDAATAKRPVVMIDRKPAASAKPPASATAAPKAPPKDFLESR